jgi:hypothetical protein
MSKRLGDLLVAEKLLSTNQLEEAIEAQCIYGGRLGTSIVELGFLSEEEIARTLSRKLQLPYIEPKLLMKIPARVITLVPQKLAWKHLVIPCRLEKKRLYLAMSDPTNLKTIDALAFRLGFIIVPVVVPELRLMLALQKYYQLELPLRFHNLSRRSRTRNRAESMPPTPENRAKETLIEVADKDILELESTGAETWPLLGEDESLDMLSYEEYQELINLPKHLRNRPETDNHGTGADPQATQELKKLHIREQQPFALFCKELSSAEKRDDIANALIDYIAPMNLGVALLMVKEGEAHGWKAAYAGEPLENFTQLHIPLDQPSALQMAAESKSCYMGTLRKEVNNILLSSRFNHKIPETVLIMPLLLRERLVCLLYLQDIKGKTREQLAEYQRLIARVTMAFEMLILKNKIQMG